MGLWTLNGLNSAKRLRGGLYQIGSGDCTLRRVAWVGAIPNSVKRSITMAAAFLPATSLRLTPYSTLRFLSFFPISNASHSLLRPLRRRVLPLFEAFPANPRRRCFCTAVSESLGSGEGIKVENYEKRFGSKVGEFRKKLKIAEVKGGADEGLSRVGQSLNIMGWVRTLRSQSSVTFIEVSLNLCSSSRINLWLLTKLWFWLLFLFVCLKINDGSCLSNLQCVLNSDAEGYDQVITLTLEQWLGLRSLKFLNFIYNTQIIGAE